MLVDNETGAEILTTSVVYVCVSLALMRERTDSRDVTDDVIAPSASENSCVGRTDVITDDPYFLTRTQSTSPTTSHQSVPFDTDLA